MEPISEQEKARRRESNESVIGTSAMEGIILDPEVLALMDQFSLGELSRAELSKGIDDHLMLLLRSARLLSNVA